ncbi:MAG: hypothetical protein HOC60_01530 [Rhodospirillaceae bacterium]|nr:hypothetical protein [Rhodospirillaceae bacterium]
MPLFLSMMSFLLSVTAIIIGAAALRRINGQNEEFMKSYVLQIREDLLKKDEQISTLIQEVQAIRRGRLQNSDTLRALEENNMRRRKAAADAQISPPVDPEAAAFAPSTGKKGKRRVA